MSLQLPLVLLLLLSQVNMVNSFQQENDDLTNQTQLFNHMSENMSLMYFISGPGVDEYPETGLFSIEDHKNGKIYVHRPVDREKTPSFMGP